MKNLKKWTSILLALVMVLAMSVTAFAETEGEQERGSITIDNAVIGHTYKAYQILYLESYDITTGKYSYKANSAWEEWLKTQTEFVQFDGDYVLWVDGADVVEFAKKAQEKAKELTPAANEKADSKTVTFTNLELGYYLLDTTLGTLCSLDTTNPDVTMEEKNEEPTIVKEVKEDSTGVYGESNTAQIGDKVEFKTTVHAKKGAENYVVHDEMSDGLTLDDNSITVYVGSVSDANKLSADNYTVKTTEFRDDCNFELAFKQTYLDTLTKDTDLIITYSAILNEKAAIDGDSNTNTNTTKLDYGEGGYTEWDTTTTKTFKFDVVKTDSDNKLLSDAKFELYDAETNGNKINLVDEGSGVYRVATNGEATKDGFTSAVIEAGRATVTGLDANTTYWLQETEAPKGYNKLTSRQKVEMKESNLTTTMSGDTWQEGNGGVHVINKAGSELPRTGGMGTTLFRVIGGILVIGAAVLLIAKKRMSSEK